MRLTSSFFAAASLIAINSASYAATQEVADKIKASFEKYLTATPGVVTVVIEGEAYGVTIDPTPLIGKTNPATSGVEIKVSPIKLKITAREAGNWQVDQNQDISLTIKGGPVGTFGYKAENVTVNGIFSEAMSGYSDLTYTIKNLESSQTVVGAGGAGTQNTTSKMKMLKGGSKSSLNASGGVDFSGSYQTGSTLTDMKLEGGPAPFALTYSTTKAAVDYSGVNLRQKEMMALIAWFIARPSPDAIKKDQSELRALAKAALPIFDSIKATGNAGKVDVKTAYGNGSLAGIDMLVDMAGLTKDGRFRENFAFNDIALPDSIFPPQFVFAKKLAPTGVSVDFSVSGFDAAAASALIVDNFDLNNDPPLKKEIELQILQKALPNNLVKFSVAESHIKSSIYDLSYQADYTFDVSGKTPYGTATIKLNGFDKTLKVLQDAAQSDPSVNQAIGPLLAAKGFAKQEGETLVWATEITATGGILVNGIDVSKMAGP